MTERSRRARSFRLRTATGVTGTERSRRALSEVEVPINTKKSMIGYMYILKCSDGSYYTGSTNNLERRLTEHVSGNGANYTKKHLPVELVYFEEFQRIDEAFYREKQVQGWSRAKKEALIPGMSDELKKLAVCTNKTNSKDYKK